MNKKSVEKPANAKRAFLSSESIIEVFAQFDSEDGKEKILRGVNAYNEKIRSAFKHSQEF